MAEQKSTRTENRGSKKERYKVFSIIEKPGDQKGFWLDIGFASRNRDDSITCKLDALPINGIIQLRLYEKKEHAGANKHVTGQGAWHKGGY